jgi:hypothetical protein
MRGMMHIKNNLQRILVGLLILMMLLACRLTDIPGMFEMPATSTPMILADCFRYFYLSAWHDLDGDSLWDASETSLAGVEFYISGNASVLSKYPCLSDEDGYCTIRTWTPGNCFAQDITITAVSPESYVPTTPTSITCSLTSVEFSCEAQFGFSASLKPITAPTFTPNPCTGWRCPVTGVVYAGTIHFSNELEGVTVTLDQTSFCSPTRGQHQTTTDSDGRFEFGDVFFHDTDRIQIQVESEGYESAQWDSKGSNCLFCSCFGSPLEIVLYAATGQ